MLRLAPDRADDPRVTSGTDFSEVLRAAQAGEHRALESLYRDLAPGVLGYLRGQGAAEPEDLASEVFVALVRHVRNFRGDERAFRTWVFSIAHHRLVDERRRLARRRSLTVDPAELAEGPAAENGGDVEEEALARLGDRWVLEALSGLTPDQRAVLLLRVVAALPVADVAAILGKAEGAVKTLQRRALLRLARRMAREAVS